MQNLENTPEVKLGVVGVSRDCFPLSLTENRLNAFSKALDVAKVEAHPCSKIVVTEDDAMEAKQELLDKGCNAVVLYLGNFGPEGPTATLAKEFPGPAMVCAAGEEDKDVLASDRGDALCGLLNCSYSLNLKNVRAYIPQYPVGTPDELVDKVEDFTNIARIYIGLKNLRVFSFGPRPQEFFACNAPIQPLYNLGVEVMENSELDLWQIYQAAGEQKDRIQSIVKEMEQELGAKGNSYPDLLPRLAQLEVALLDFKERNLGAREFGVFANKCWPAFEPQFGFVPCYVNSRLAARGVPVSCEVDLYGALSEYLLQLASQKPATILDVNNSVPKDVIPSGTDLKGAAKKDLFMGFHCGNTPCSCLTSCTMKYQLIMNRLMEDGNDPDITRGTVEGTIRPGPVTLFRLQGSSDCHLQSYIAEGNVLDVDPCTFGGTGVFAIPDFARFYRHVMVGKHFPHHGAVGFSASGKLMYEALALAGVQDVGFPLPETKRYEGENPFET